MIVPILFGLSLFLIGVGANQFDRDSEIGDIITGFAFAGTGIFFLYLSYHTFIS